MKHSILVLFGGESHEHEVSISSARNVLGALDKDVYDIALGYIDKTGRWWLINDIDAVSDQTMELLPVLGSKSFVTQPTGKIISPDVIFPVLHGEFGEDGTVQGLAGLIHIPIVGAGLSASVIAIDKDITKRIVGATGIPTVPYIVHRSNDAVPAFDDLTAQLGSILFVKPACLGSSVGVSKVQDQDSFVKALDVAHALDSKVLIEKAISGRELEIAVLGNNSDFKLSAIGEIKADNEFYSYESKYADDTASTVIIPADIRDGAASKIKEYAATAYRAIEGRGLARIDFFLAADGNIYLNEINTLPGFTNISMYPKLWQHAGMSYNELVDKLINLALEGGS